MVLDDTDRRRLIVVTIMTIVALPALWLTVRGEGSGAPNVASADVDVGLQAAADTVVAGRTSAMSIDPPLVDTPPVFLGGPAAAPGAGRTEVAVPAPGGVTARTTATYRREGIDVTTCVVDGVATGSRLTVVNLANNRSVACTARLAAADEDVGLVMHAEAFLQLADLTDAPIPVEIRQ